MIQFTAEQPEPHRSRTWTPVKDTVRKMGMKRDHTCTDNKRVIMCNCVILEEADEVGSKFDALDLDLVPGTCRLEKEKRTTSRLALINWSLMKLPSQRSSW